MVIEGPLSPFWRGFSASTSRAVMIFATLAMGWATAFGVAATAPPSGPPMAACAPDGQGTGVEAPATGSCGSVWLAVTGPTGRGALTASRAATTSSASPTHRRRIIFTLVGRNGDRSRFPDAYRFARLGSQSENAGT